MIKRKAIIISISNYKLSNREKRLIKKEKPWGLILFKRNIKSLEQLKKLTKDIRHTMKDKKFPIFIDEEGGSISRLNQLINIKVFSQRYFGNLFLNNREISIKIYKIYINKISAILKDVGININTVPVLDRRYANTTKILKDRIFSKNISTIKHLGKVCIDQFKKNKILTVMKHVPGHGCASSDSHKVLPVVNKSQKKLIKEDIECFKGLNPFFAMTAHVLYKKIDNQNCATHSKKLIHLIRKKIKFTGLIISDDISMKALKKDLKTNALKSLEAGCNLALYCKGNLNQLTMIIKQIPYIDDFTKKKTNQIYKFLS